MEFTKEQIEKMAEEYAEEQNSAYTNDYYGFIAGFEKALSLFIVCGKPCDELRTACDKCKADYYRWEGSRSQNDL